MSEEGESGASTPNPRDFDPGASEFVPTTRTPATDGRAYSGQLRAAFNTMPGSHSSGRKAVRPALPLFSSSTWSPTSDQPIRSAALPPKPSWESFSSRGSTLNTAPSQTSPTHSLNGFNSPGGNSLSGLGMTGNNISFTRGEDGRISGAKLSPSHSTVRYTQTEEYHNSIPSPHSAPHPSFISRTDPLPQQPFGFSHQAGTSSSGGSSASQYLAMPGTPNSSTSTFATQAGTEQHSSDDQQSVCSGSVALSDHYSRIHPEQAGAKGEVWFERSHPRSLRRALKDPQADWEEAYPGALSILTCMNPETYQMPYGTRIVNIKTEYPRNILLSIKLGKYSVMEKVSERIMKVWEARENTSEKVLFLFSVNGSKRFCGVAEMCGPWDPSDRIDKWENNAESYPCVGTFPVTWVFLKDVNYYQFAHIRQPHNSHPVGNMWNGMNFPSDTGREVMEAYVKTPATSSILGHPRNYAENEGLAPASTYSRRGGFNVRSGRGGRGDYRGGFRGGHFGGQSWRPQYDSSGHAHDGESDEDSTPTAGKLSGKTLDSNGPPPKFNSPANPADHLKPGQLFTIIVNDQGKLEVVTKDGPLDKLDISSTSGENPRGDSTRGTGRGGFRGNLHGARSLGSLHHSSSSTSTLQAPNEPACHRLNSAGSMGRMGQGQGDDPTSPLTGSMHHLSLGHQPVQSPSGAGFGANVPYSSSQNGNEMRANNVSFGVMPRAGEGTPTHRPAPHGSRRPDNVNTEPPTENALKAKFHTIAAEQYSLQDQLQQGNMTDINIRVLNAKIARVLAEKREVQAQLAMMGFNPETVSPVRHDSFSSTDPDSVSSASGQQISPVRAEDGRRLRSISKLESPAQPQESGEFDKAPGGSDRRKGHAATESWDLHMKKSITDLLKSPQKSPVAPRPAHETSSFFPENVTNSNERRAISFPIPRGQGDSKVSSPVGHQNFSFPPPSDRVGTPGGSNGQQKSNSQRPAGQGGVRLDS